MIFDVPRVTTSVRDSVSGVNSAVVYNVDYNHYEYYNGTAWVVLLSATDSNVVQSFNGRSGVVTLNDNDVASLGDFTASGTLTVKNEVLLGSQELTLRTSSLDPSVSGASGNSGSVLFKSDGTLWVKYGSESNQWTLVNNGSLTNEPTGFTVDSNGEVDRTSSTLSVNDGSRTVSLSVSPGYSYFSFFVRGQLHRKFTTQSVSFLDEEGLHYFYFNSSGQLVTTTNFSLSIFHKEVYVAYLYWDATNKRSVFLSDERHGCSMDSHTHARLHFKDGAVYVSGGALSNFSIGDGSLDAHSQYSVSSGAIRDEDILHNLNSVSQTTAVPVLYRDGTNWRSVLNGSGLKVHYNSRLYYNSASSGSYSLTELPSGGFCCYHVLATNSVSYPYVVLMGLNEYLNANKAQEGALSEIGQYTGLPFVEFVFLGTVIYETSNSFTNLGKCRVVQTETGSNYVDWRFNVSLNPTTSGLSVHNNLGGIQGGSGGNYYHSNQPVNSSDSVSFAGLSVTGSSNLSGTVVLNSNTFPTSGGSEGQALLSDGAGNLYFGEVAGGASELTVSLNLGDYGGSNPFSVNNFVTLNSSGLWEKATSGNSYVDNLWYVSSSSGSTLKLRNSGEVTGLSGLVAGSYYYLSEDVAGTLSSSPGYYNKKVLRATSSSSGVLLDREESQRFEERLLYTLSNGSEVTLNDSTFTFKLDGYVVGDSKTLSFSGVVVSGSPTEATIETSSDYVSNVEVCSNVLSFFMRGNDLIMKNNLGSTKNIVLYRKKAK